MICFYQQSIRVLTLCIHTWTCNVHINIHKLPKELDMIEWACTHMNCSVVYKCILLSELIWWAVSFLATKNKDKIEEELNSPWQAEINNGALRRTGRHFQKSSMRCSQPRIHCWWQSLCNLRPSSPPAK